MRQNSSRVRFYGSALTAEEIVQFHYLSQNRHCCNASTIVNGIVRITVFLLTVASVISANAQVKTLNKAWGE